MANTKLAQQDYKKIQRIHMEIRHRLFCTLGITDLCNLPGRFRTTAYLPRPGKSKK